MFPDSNVMENQGMQSPVQCVNELYEHGAFEKFPTHLVNISSGEDAWYQPKQSQFS